ncbi:MAG: hypothetical protein EHM40_02855 [Chloroflexi bacterium]|nr:MAG: hypothetical protein EHM40_02855 [Chloroflexota bacterium]
MASQVIETVERGGKTIWVYDNGMEKDASNGHIVKPPPHVLIDSSDKSIALHRARQEQKRARLLAGAAKTLERGGDWETPSDLDVVEALGEAVMMKALNPDNAKQVDAARFILQESGLSASQERGEVEPPPPGIPTLVLLLSHLHEREPEAIEGLVTESDISASNKVRIDEQDNGVIDASPTDQKADE